MNQKQALCHVWKGIFEIVFPLCCRMQLLAGGREKLLASPHEGWEADAPAETEIGISSAERIMAAMNEHSASTMSHLIIGQGHLQGEIQETRSSCCNFKIKSYQGSNCTVMHLDQITTTERKEKGLAIIPCHRFFQTQFLILPVWNIIMPACNYWCIHEY